MDIATVLGLAGGALLIVVSVLLGGSPVMFFDIPSILIVFGGTIATSLIKFSIGDVLNSIGVAMKAFTNRIQSTEAVIEQMIGYAKTAKREGMIALEKEQTDDEFIAKMLRYIADGFDVTLVGDLLDKETRLMLQRHTTGQKVFKGMGTSAPAFGMIGTLIGLVQMLANMADSSKIGPAMAVALLTTLYGALLANLVCLPLADKLALRSQQEQEIRRLVREAALGIAGGMTPIVLEESLRIYLAPKSRQKNGGRGETGGRND